MKRSKTIISILAVLIIIGGSFLVWQYNELKVAHSSFGNYAKFRGCSTITSQTATSGTCMTSSGQNIKIVEFQSKWFLDGDLPVCGLQLGSTCLFNWP